MRKVWKSLNEAGIIFLSVHDEIIIKEENTAEAESIMRGVFDRDFKYYKLNIGK